MSRRAKLCTVGVGALLLSLAAVLYVQQLTIQLERASALPPKPNPPPCEPIELSGILRRPPKWGPRLELVPAGRFRSIDLCGDLVYDLPAGARIRVKGVVRSGLHTGGTPDHPSAFPAQWMICLFVTELEIQTDAVTLRELKSQGE
jgi:hypothetical protein